MQKLIVSEKYNNKKLKEFIMHYFPLLNSNTFYKALRQKDIKINNKRVHQDVLVHSFDEIFIYISDNLLFGFSSISHIYEDDNILIINKPAGVSVTENKYNETTLSDLVKKQFGKNLEPCHRLDRNTTGLIIYAKNNQALHILLQKFKNLEIEKHYHATVFGIPNKKHTILTAYLFKDKRKSLVYISDTAQKNYSKIITEYTVLSENKTNNTSVLDIILHTGKTHQIRAHLAHIGYPIIGDGKYGINEINKKFKAKTQLLCSYKIKFNFRTTSGILEYLNNQEFSLE